MLWPLFLFAFAFCLLPSAAAFAACSSPTGTAGEIIFNADAAVEQYCDGSSWISFGKKTGSIPERSTPPSSGLVGHWKFDESSGTTANDSIGTNDGTLTSSVITWFPTGGKIDGAVTFSAGSNPYISYPSRDFGNQFTISLWIRPSSDTGDNLLANKTSWDTNDGLLFFLWPTTNAIIFNTGNGSVADNATSADNVYSLNTWQHIAVTVDKTAGTATIYVNGTDVTTDSTIRTDFATSSAWTLATSTNVSNNFRGTMDDLRIYNRVLSASEVASLYSAGMGLSGPVAWWKLDETSGTTVTDSVGSNNGTMVNTSWNWSPSGGYDGNGALELSNGDGPYASYPSYDFGALFTITLWAKPSISTATNLLANKISWNTNDGFWLYADPTTGVVTFNTGNPTNSFSDDAATTTGVYAQNQWQHIAITVNRTAGTAHLYINGTDETSDSSIRTDFNTSGAWTLGTTTNVSDVFNGRFDDVRIYNRILSDSEIQNQYNTGVREVLDNPIAWWKLDESTGTTAEDSIGTNDGTLTGDSVTWQPTSGKNNGAIQLGGTYDYIVKASATGLPALRSNLTISAWYYLTTTPVNWGYVASLVNQGANAKTSLGISNTNGVAIGKYGSSTGIISTAATPSLNAWHHYTYTYDGTTNRVYIDGTQVGSSTNLPDNATPDEVWIGNDGYQSDTTQFTGLIDDVRIYDRTLSADQIAALYSITACHGPAGDAGTIVFNADRSVLQYCNGSEWVAVDNGPSATASYNTTGLAGHWKLDESSGTTATDSSGNNNTGTLTNGPTWTTGKIGGATNFDGTNDYIGIPASSTLNNISAMTVMAWIRPNSADSPARIVTKSTECCMGQTSGGWRFIVSDNASALDKGLDFGVDYSGTNLDVNRNNLLMAGVWQHVAVTWDGTPSASGVTMYVNGSAVWTNDTDATGSRVDDSGTAIGIGGRASGLNPGDWFDGKMDDVRIYNRVLSANEIAALYSNTSPPVGMWLLDDGSGTTATDSAGSNDGTLTNGPVWLPSGGHDGGGAVQFDGTNDYIGGTLPGYDWQATGLTLSLWVKDWPSTDQDDVIIELWDSSDTGRRLRISTDNFAPLQRYQIQAGRQWSAREIEIHYPGSTAITNASDWKHLVVTLSSTEGIFYLDGVAVASDTAVTPFGTVNLDSFRIGGGTTDYNGAAVATYESGTVDDVRVWDRALSATEVADLYNASGPAMPTPIAEWKMDEGSGTTTADSIGSNDGTLTNGPTWGTGLFGGAVQFDGTDDLVSISSGSVPVLTDSAGTISAWIKADSSDIGQDNYWPIFREYYHDNHNNGGGIGFFLYQGGPSDPMTVGSTFGDTSNNFQNIFSSSPFILAGQWYHVAVSWTASTATLFVDGSEVDSEARTVPMGTSSSNGSDNINIGYNNGTNGGGLIDDVRIYDTALTAAQIRSLYQATACTGPSGAPGTMIYNNTHSVLQYCNGTNWVGIGK